MENEKTIYFIQFTARLHRLYLQFAEAFKTKGITLVPVSPRVFLEIAKNKKNIHVLALTTNFTDKNILENKIAGKIKTPVKMKNYTFYHISSFIPVDEFNNGPRGKSYFFYQLPMPQSQLIGDIVARYNEIQDNHLKWPGGVRVHYRKGTLG